VFDLALKSLEENKCYWYIKIDCSIVVLLINVTIFFVTEIILVARFTKFDMLDMVVT